MNNDISTEPRKRGRPKGKGGANIDVKNNLTVKKDELSRIVSESVQYIPRKPPKDNKELSDRLDDYFAQCIESGQIPTVEDMALALGITRMGLWQWENGRDRERSKMIQRAKEVLAAIDAKLVSENKIPQVTYIFRAKNYFGMRDQQELVMGPHVDPPGDEIDIERLKQKYLDAGYDSNEYVTLDESRKNDTSEVIEDDN